MAEKTPFEKAVNAAAEALERATELCADDAELALKIAGQWTDLARVIGAWAAWPVNGPVEGGES